MRSLHRSSQKQGAYLAPRLASSYSCEKHEDRQTQLGLLLPRPLEPLGDSGLPACPGSDIVPNTSVFRGALAHFMKSMLSAIVQKGALRSKMYVGTVWLYVHRVSTEYRLKIFNSPSGGFEIDATGDPTSYRSSVIQCSPTSFV
jgi:hypothetical protein